MQFIRGHEEMIIGFSTLISLKNPTLMIYLIDRGTLNAIKETSEISERH